MFFVMPFRDVILFPQQELKSFLIDHDFRAHTKPCGSDA